MNVPTNIVDTQRLVKLVGYFATPLALLLGFLGIVVSGIDGHPRSLCLGLLGFSGYLNLAFPKILSETDPSKKAVNIRIRMVLNVIVNSLLVYFLGEWFRPMWLILALAPFATAIYGTRQKTLETVAISAAILVAIHLLRTDGASFSSWAETSAHVAFIAMISLMINGLASLVVRPEKVV